MAEPQTLKIKVEYDYSDLMESMKRVATSLKRTTDAFNKMVEILEEESKSRQDVEQE